MWSKRTPESPDRVTERLIVLLRDPQPDTRRTAALSLGKISDPQSISALVSALSDPDEEVRQWSAWALGNFGSSLTKEALVSLSPACCRPIRFRSTGCRFSLKSNDYFRRGDAGVSRSLHHLHPETQLTIIQTLAQFEFPFAYALFIQALKSPDPLIRQTAIAGLGELGDPRGLLIMRTHLLQDSNVGVRSEAAFRLGKLGGPADIPALRQAKETDSDPQCSFLGNMEPGANYRSET